MNISQQRDLRFWKKWRASGAVASFPKPKPAGRRRFNIRAAVESYNTFVHSTPFPTHSSRYGYIDEGDRRQRWLLD